ncbi:MAG: chemotaxis protein CheE [Brevundimonas sp.]|uniref:chemotaxis protein CheE n=1 Tax=Brevundimonas sp. TaxID=1871086 RepID=UPI0024897547|nr:chemotaxis protein CheE [Brevundimonas sp.]MDI1328556.1 chemotaxis protein CheE [Brevundimonas sp.]
MAVITHARTRSKLSKMIDSPGGVSVGVALAQARANIESKRAEAMAVVEVQIAALEAVVPPANLEEQGFRLNEAYRAANAVIDAASPFELLDLCNAASGLCDLIDGAPANQTFDWRIVTVHARSLRLLQTLPVEEAAARATVLDSLKLVADRKLPPKA